MLFFLPPSLSFFSGCLELSRWGEANLVLFFLEFPRVCEEHIPIYSCLLLYLYSCVVTYMRAGRPVDDVQYNNVHNHNEDAAS